MSQLLIETPSGQLDNHTNSAEGSRIPLKESRLYNDLVEKMPWLVHFQEILSSLTLRRIGARSEARLAMVSKSTKLLKGIPENNEAPTVAEVPTSAQTGGTPIQASSPVQPGIPTTGPNANPLDLFPQGLPNLGLNTGESDFEFLRNSPQFQALQAVVQSNPQILQPLLQELGQQNPEIMRLIQEHQGEFLGLLNEPAQGNEGISTSQLAAGTPTIEVSPEEYEAIERLAAMGFDSELVLEVFFACNKNEELAANYLLDHMQEFEDDLQG